MTVRAFYDLPAPAKINLFLHLVGRRADGYHLLQSLFVFIDWCDLLHIELRDDGRLQRHDLGFELPADDLCLRAARALQSASGLSLGADITVDKRIPWGAGMGGGSSDAATTLLALNRLWGLNWPRARLLEIGLRLGADVPFFVGGDNALVEGIGERLSPMAVAPQWLMVVKPPSIIETRALFQSPLLDRNGVPDILAGLSGDSPVVRALIEAGRNDLQVAAEAESADISQAASLLQSQFGNSSMTGSGSAVFARAGRCDSSSAAGLEAGRGRPIPLPVMPAAGWSGRMCCSLKVHPLRDWVAG